MRTISPGRSGNAATPMCSAGAVPGSITPEKRRSRAVTHKNLRSRIVERVEKMRTWSRDHLNLKGHTRHTEVTTTHGCIPRLHAFDERRPLTVTAPGLEDGGLAGRHDQQIVNR